MKYIALFVLLLFSLSAKAAGTATVISNDGYLLTNKHVANDDGLSNFHRYMFYLLNGKVYKAILIGSPDNIDLALYKILKSNTLLSCSIIGTIQQREGDALIIKMYDLHNKDYYRISEKVPSYYHIHDFADNKIVKTTSYPAIPTQFAFKFEMILYPGNSGSPIFDKLGYLVGVGFASNSYTSYGLYLNSIKTFLNDVKAPIKCSGGPDNTVGWLFS